MQPTRLALTEGGFLEFAEDDELGPVDALAPDVEGVTGRGASERPPLRDA